MRATEPVQPAATLPADQSIEPVIYSIVSCLIVVLLLAMPVAHAQVVETERSVAADTVIVVDTTGAGETSDPRGWRVEPRLRGIHGVAMTGFVLYTLGISADADILFDPRSLPPFALGVRTGFERGNHARFFILDGAGGLFVTIDLLARFTIGGRSTELTCFAGYAWVAKNSQGFETPHTYTESIQLKYGGEFRWMFVPKYLGFLVRISETDNMTTGGLGMIIGWEP